MRPPLRSPTVVRPLLFVHHRARDNLVGCCVQLSIGGRLKQQRILIYSFFAPKSDGQKGVMAFSPIVFALRAASPEYYTPTIRPAFSWLLRLSMQQEPSQSEAPSPSLCSFFVSLHLPPETMGKRPPPRVPPVRIASPIPPPHRHHRSGGCCVTQSISGHSRPVLRPPRNIQMGEISVTQRRGPNVARASPGAGRLH